VTPPSQPRQLLQQLLARQKPPRKALPSRSVMIDIIVRHVVLSVILGLALVTTNGYTTLALNRLFPITQ